MTVRGRPGLTALLFALVATGGRGAGAAAPERPKPPPPEPPAIGRFEVGTGQRIDAVLPGPIVAALVAGEKLVSGVLLLVRPEGEVDGPRSLYRLETQAGGGLVELAAGLPGGAKALFAGDLDGDGEAEVLLGGMGELDTLGPVSGLGARPEPKPLLRHPGFDPRSLSPKRLRKAGALGPFLDSGLLVASEAGALYLYEPGQPAPRLRTRIPLPISVAREPTGLRLASPRVTLLDEEGAGGPRFAIGPEAHGDRRLRSFLVELPADGEAVRTEAWSRLPSPEGVEGSRYAVLGGKTVLIALTQTAGKLALFENRKLRVFSLAADRTRAGKLPLLSYDTGAPRWAEPDMHVTDTDGDGKEDLVLVYTKGLTAPELALEALPGLGGGRFSTQARHSTVEQPPSKWRYGHDLTGDGRPDLVAVGTETVTIFAGAASSGRVIEKQPRWTLPLRKPEEDPEKVVLTLSASGAEVDREEVERGEEVEIADLDGDGRPEILVLSPDVVGRGVLRVLRLPRP